MTIFRYILIGLIALLIAPNVGMAEEKPNIILIFMDNFGWGEPGFNGGGIIRGTATPRLDQLAEEGLRLTNFNVEVQCTPSRSAIMTGRYAIRSGNATVPLGEGVYGLVQWEKTMAEMFSEAGYSTAIYGKWHLGRTKGRFPTDQGFDEWYGIPNTTDESAWSSLDAFKKSGIDVPYVLEGRKGMNPKKVRVYDMEYRAQIDGDLTDKAIDFIGRQAKAKKPFFVYIPYTATHFPTLPHPDFAGKTGNGKWADLLHQIDTYVGRLIDETEKLGISDTIIIFTADNGPEAPPSGQSHMTVEGVYGGSAGPWRGTLFTGFEGALRVPFAMRWPAKIAAGSESDEIVHAMDLFPTFAKIVGGKVPKDRVIDGVDQSALLLGKQKVYMGTKVFAVKWNNWKIHFSELESWAGETITYEMPRLYDLYVDPGETENVLFPNTWVLRVALPLLDEHMASLKKHPPIKVGEKDPYEPGK
jgi:arylsulfatase